MKKYSPQELITSMKEVVNQIKALFPEADADINTCLQGKEHHNHDLAKRCFEVREDISKIPPIEEIELNGDENPNSIFDKFSQSPDDWELRNKLRAILAQKASPKITQEILKKALKKIKAMSQCEVDHNDSKPMHFIGTVAYIAIDAISYAKKNVYAFLEKLSDIYLSHTFSRQQRFSVFATYLEIDFSHIVANLSSRRNHVILKCVFDFIMGGAEHKIFDLAPFIQEREKERETLARLFQKDNPYLAVFILWQAKERDTDFINKIVSEHLKNHRRLRFPLLDGILLEDLDSKYEILSFLKGYLAGDEAKENKPELCSLAKVLAYEIYKLEQEIKNED